MPDIFLPSLFNRLKEQSTADTLLGFHQGTVTAWDSSTGTNTVYVNGNPFTNLRSLLGPEGLQIRAGDAVALLKYQTTYFVLGRVTASGDDRGFGIVSATVAAQESTSSTPFTDLATVGPSATVFVGSNRRVIVMIGATIFPGGTGGNEAGTSVAVTGASSITATTTRMLYTRNPFGASKVFPLTAADGLNAGINVFTMKYFGTAPASFFQDRSLTVIPF